jgi:hypothetical protein
MAHIHYRVVPHDGGWAYRLGDVFSEPYSTKAAAVAAAQAVATEQRTPGDSTLIEYEDEHGVWHIEKSEPLDRPEADVIA